MTTRSQITLPVELQRLLEQDRSIAATVHMALSALEPLLLQSDLEFFPDECDCLPEWWHGVQLKA